MHARSYVKIVRATRDVYAAVVDDALVLRLGPGHWEPEGVGVTWQRAESGNDWVTWERR